MSVHFSSAKTTWNTPEWLCREIQKFYMDGFLDPCADSVQPEWTGASCWYTQEHNGLHQLWEMPVYCNPPYGKEIGFWTRKFAAEWRSRRMQEGLLLLPARTETRWWRELLSIVPLILFFHGRLQFNGHANSAPFPSALLYVGSQRRGERLRDLLRDRTWAAHPPEGLNLGPGLSYQQAKMQNPEAFRKSQRAGGNAKAKAQADPVWLHDTVADFQRWLAEREATGG